MVKVGKNRNSIPTNYGLGYLRTDVDAFVVLIARNDASFISNTDIQEEFMENISLLGFAKLKFS